jgi:SAM-dependent methyltransferase
MIPYGLLYRLGFAPWERRDVAESWQPLLDGPHAPAPGRALDVGCGSGRDAVYLAKRGWQVTAVDSVEKAVASAKQRAVEEGVDVQWVAADVAQLGRLGLKPGYDLLYDFGCIHGLADAARQGAVAGLTQLAAPGATLLITAFKAGRRIALPRGMNQQDVVALLGDRWDLEESRSVATEDMPAFLRRANPTVYRLTRHTQATSHEARTAAATEDLPST